MEDPQKLAQQLRKNGERASSFFSGLEDADWEKQVYADGHAWTVTQLFTHIVETEKDIPLLVKNILGGHIGVPEGFDIDDHNFHQVQDAGLSSGEKLVGLFRERREATISMVENLKMEDLNKRGRHPFLGETKVYEMLRLMSLHIQIHIRDVRKVI